jgi:predicted XRE-type DNA-binding protein
MEGKHPDYPRSEIIVTQDGPARCRAGKAAVSDLGQGTELMAHKLKRTRGSDNIFADLGFPPAEAENLKMRSDLLIAIEMFYRKSGLTQAQAAKRLGITQPRLNALLKSRIDQFSLDALVNIASRAGLDVRLVIRKAA